MKVIATIPSFDKNKSYSDVVKSKHIPVYPNQCPCHYGYECDDPNFDYSKPIGYIEVDKDDERNSVLDTDT